MTAENFFSCSLPALNIVVPEPQRLEQKRMSRLI